MAAHVSRPSSPRNRRRRPALRPRVHDLHDLQPPIRVHEMHEMHGVRSTVQVHDMHDLHGAA